MIRKTRLMNGVLLVWLVVGLIVTCPSTALAQTLYGANGAQGNISHLHILDPADGSVIEIVGSIGFAVTGLAIDPTTGVLYGSTGNRDPVSPGYLITIDTETGDGTAVGEIIKIDETSADIAFTSDGTLYGWLEKDTDELIEIDKATGLGALVGGPSGLRTYGSGLAASAADELFFTGTGDTFDDDPLRGLLHTIDRDTGLVDTATPLVGGSARFLPIGALTFDCNGALYGARLDNKDPTRPADLITIDPDTGQITLLGQTVDRLDAIAFSPFCEADLSIEVTDTPDPVAVGNVVVYWVTAMNNGPDTEREVAVELTVPEGADFLFASSGCTEVSGTVTCDAGELTAGSDTTITIGVTATATGLLTSHAEVTGGFTSDPDLSNNATDEDTDVRSNPDLDLDGDVDLNDFAMFQKEFTGPGG